MSGGVFPRLLKFVGVALLLAVGVPVHAQPNPAQTIDLKDGMCSAVTAHDLPAAAVARLNFDCARAPQSYQDRWLWLSTSAPELRRLSSPWHLLVDQTRFASMRLIVVRADGTITEQRFASGQAQDHWGPGGFLTFEAGAAPPQRIYLGVEGLVNVDTMRKVRAVTDDAFDRTQIAWVALIALFTGVVGASLAYTSFLYAGLRYPFLSRYGIWSLAILAHGLCWSNMIFYAAPGLAGAWGVRLNLVTAGTAALLGTLFMTAYIEREALPARLRTFLLGTGWLTLAGSIAAAFDPLSPGFAYVADRVANASMAVGTATVLVSLVIAWRRGSRAARFYALAWVPALTVFVIRALRNFYVVPHADWMDMALFVASIVQAVLLSAAISDRFRELERERNRAEAEGAEYRRLADLDPLTGIKNRRGFVARAERLLAAAGTVPVGLLVFDIDRFKRINDVYGHDAGDQVLEAIGRVLAPLSAADTAVARLGGEEFGVMIARPGTELTALAEELRGRISELRFAFGGEEVQVTTSIGVACADRDMPFVELYREADRALYRAKSAGRDQVKLSAGVLMRAA